MTHSLEFRLPDGSRRSVPVDRLLNAGYAGRNTADVQHHIDELAQMGVPGPSRVPTLYPLPSLLALHTGHVQAPHGRTSGEAEWAIAFGDDPQDRSGWLVTAACDHTDRDLEVHGVAWSKQTAPDVLGDLAWPWPQVQERFAEFTLRASVTGADGRSQTIQQGLAGDLLAPEWWADRLHDAGLLLPRTVLLSGTLPMIAGVDPFAARWQVELADPDGTAVSRVAYDVEQLPPAWA